MILQRSVEVECPTYGLYSGSYVLSDYRGRIRLARTPDQTIGDLSWVLLGDFPTTTSLIFCWLISERVIKGGCVLRSDWSGRIRCGWRFWG